jgi:hypothetical protein
MRRFSILSGVVLALAGTAFAQADPATLPARDRHEGMLVAADPCNDAARAKARFGKASPIPAGIVPIEVFFRNETQQPLRINLATIRLEISPAGRQRQHIEPLDASEVALLIAHPGGTPNPESREPSSSGGGAVVGGGAGVRQEGRGGGGGGLDRLWIVPTYVDRSYL